jgi:hypothetical protein
MIYRINTSLSSSAVLHDCCILIVAAVQVVLLCNSVWAAPLNAEDEEEGIGVIHERK